jgi:hypothetical protein
MPTAASIGGTILLNGVNKIDVNGIDATDFRFAP